MMAADDPLHSLAIHEAAHAVAHVLAFQAMKTDPMPAFDCVLITWTEALIDSRGRKIDQLGLVDGPDFNCQATSPLQMEWAILVILAGPIAAAVVPGDDSHIALDFGPLDDDRQAASILADYNRATGEQAEMRHFEERARALVVGAWSAIEAVAAALLEAEAGELEPKTRAEIASHLGEIDSAAFDLSRIRKLKSAQIVEIMEAAGHARVGSETLED